MPSANRQRLCYTARLKACPLLDLGAGDEGEAPGDPATRNAWSEGDLVKPELRVRARHMKAEGLLSHAALTALL
jgi:hypothetical protein